jgi:hypothetical protein
MKIDMHIHSNYSRDSIAKADGIFKTAKKAGLDGIAITDHNTCESWKEIQKEAKKNYMKLILGEEISILKDGERVGDALAYFTNEEIKRGTLDEIIDQVREQGGIVGIAHPFDMHKSRFDEELVKKVDAVEVYNSRVLFPSANERAMELAKKYKVGMTAGSDAHTSWEVGNACTYAKVSDLEEFRKAIVKRKTRVYGKMINPVLRIFPTLAKLGIIG